MSRNEEVTHDNHCHKEYKHVGVTNLKEVKMRLTKVVQSILVFLSMVNLMCSAEVYYVKWTNNFCNENCPEKLVEFNSEGDSVVHIDPHDQANVICPFYDSSTKENLIDTNFTIYNVTKKEFDECRLNEKRNIVLICDTPHKATYRTITFRKFSPTPGGFEFHLGEDYYFIKIPNQNGGRCGEDKKLRLIFRMASRPTKVMPIRGRERSQEKSLPLGGASQAKKNKSNQMTHDSWVIQTCSIAILLILKFGHED